MVVGGAIDSTSLYLRRTVRANSIQYAFGSVSLVLRALLFVRCQQTNQLAASAHDNQSWRFSAIHSNRHQITTNLCALAATTEAMIWPTKEARHSKVGLGWSRILSIVAGQLSANRWPQDDQPFAAYTRTPLD